MVLDPPQAPDGPTRCRVEVLPREAAFADGVEGEADESPPDIGARDSGGPVLVTSCHGQRLRLRMEPAPFGRCPLGTATNGFPTLGSRRRRGTEPVARDEAVGMDVHAELRTSDIRAYTVVEGTVVGVLGKVELVDLIPRRIPNPSVLEPAFVCPPDI